MPLADGVRYTNRMNDKDKLWFKQRRYGWGWTPITKEGRLTVIISVLVIFVSAILILPAKPAHPSSLQLVAFFLIFLSVVSILIGIGFAKGPVPRWQWGDKRNDSDKNK